MMLVSDMTKALRLNRPALSRGLGSDFMRMFWFIDSELVTTDTRMTIRTQLDEEPEFQGGLPETALALLESCDPKQELTAKASGEHVVFKAGSTTFKLPLSDASHYDDLWPEDADGPPEFGEKFGTLKAKPFADALGSVFKVLGNDPSRLEYRGVTCIVQKDEKPYMSLFAFTGRTIGCDTIDFNGDVALKYETFGRGNEAFKERRILLPDVWCAPALALLSGATYDDKAKIALSQHQIGISLGNTQMMIQAEAGRDEKPSDFLKQLSVARDAADKQKWLQLYAKRKKSEDGDDFQYRDDFLKALERAHTIANGPLEKSRTLLSIKGGKATLTTTSVFGEAIDTFPAKHVDAAGKFNPQWLADTLKGFTHFALLPKQQLIILASPDEYADRFFLANAAGG